MFGLTELCLQIFVDFNFYIPQLHLINCYSMSFNKRSVFPFLVCCVFCISGSSCSGNKTSLVKNRKINVEYKAYNYGAITGEKPIEFSSRVGSDMLIKTKYSRPFFALAPHFSGQAFPTTCGPASARIVLSAIYEREGRSFLPDPYHSLSKDNNGVDRQMYIMTEENIFIPYSSHGGKAKYSVISRQEKNDSGVYSGGIGVQDLTDVIRAHPGVDAKYVLFSGDDSSKAGLDQFREIVKNIMLSDDVYLIVNYHMSAMYNRNSGHYSPVVAYDESGDYVLVMDVASHLGVWVWVKLEDLYRLMNGVLSGIQRGYIVVKRSGSSFDLNKVKNYDDGIRDLVQKHVDMGSTVGEDKLSQHNDESQHNNDVASSALGADNNDNQSDTSDEIQVSVVKEADKKNDTKSSVYKLRRINVGGKKPVKKMKVTTISSKKG